MAQQHVVPTVAVEISNASETIARVARQTDAPQQGALPVHGVVDPRTALAVTQQHVSPSVTVEIAHARKRTRVAHAKRNRSCRDARERVTPPARQAHTETTSGDGSQPSLSRQHSPPQQCCTHTVATNASARGRRAPSYPHYARAATSPDARQPHRWNPRHLPLTDPIGIASTRPSAKYVGQHHHARRPRDALPVAQRQRLSEAVGGSTSQPLPAQSGWAGRPIAPPSGGR